MNKTTKNINDTKKKQKHIYFLIPLGLSVGTFLLFASFWSGVNPTEIPSHPNQKSSFISGCDPTSLTFNSQSPSCYGNPTSSLSEIKINLWNTFSQFFNSSIICVISTPVFAAPPAQGWGELCRKASEKSEKVEGPKLTVKWSAEFQPQAIGWVGSLQCTQVSSSVSSVTIDRMGRGEIPSRLLIVPKDTSLQPQVLDISASQKELNFSTQKINAGETWVWGNTLKSHCRDGCRNEQANEINISYHQGGKFIFEGRGVFLFNLKRSLHHQPLLFFGSDTSLRQISIEGFQHLNTTNVLKPTEKVWGSSREAKVKFSRDKPCPLY